METLAVIILMPILLMVINRRMPSFPHKVKSFLHSDDSPNIKIIWT
jgi:hypothetical protein